ncbi:MAG: GIY-YIG nuclease family protein [Parvibaculum sp.]|nr:GIY-YIG nuclease family protein [Parvibaculum sp.]
MDKISSDQVVAELLEIWPTANFPDDYVPLNDLDCFRGLKMSDRKKLLKKGKKKALHKVVQERLDEVVEAVEMEDGDLVDVLMEALPSDLSNFKGLSEREKKICFSKASESAGRPFDQDSVVYFVGDEEFVKIGHTTNLESRFKALKTSSPRPLRIHLVLPGTRDDEREFHKRFSGLRAKGEWFQLSDGLLKFIKLHLNDSRF